MIQRVLQENMNAQARRLDFFADLLDRIFHQIVQDESSIRHTLLLASVLRVRQSSKAVQLLAGEGMVEEILSIARTLVEVEVNAVYLQHAGEGEVNHFLEFQPETLYKQVRALRPPGNHALGSGLMQKLGDLVLRGPETGVKTPDPAWTRRSLMDRAQIADNASHIPIMVPLVTRCYPKGHAAAHGTIGALDTFIGSLNSGRLAQREDRLSDLTEALFTVNLCLLTLSLYLNDLFRLGMDEAIDEAANADSAARASLRGV